MNKNILLFSIVGIIFALLVFMLIDTPHGNLEMSKPVVSVDSEKKSIDTTSTQISYTDSTKQEANLSDSQKTEENPKLDPTIEAITMDTSRTFEITLINPLKTTDGLSQDTRYVQGKIDGKPFTLHVPKHLIENGADVSLSIKDLSSGVITSAPAAFIHDMKDPSIHPEIEIDSTQPDNYTQTMREQVTPPRPGA